MADKNKRDSRKKPKPRYYAQRKPGTRYYGEKKKPRKGKNVRNTRRKY